MNDLNCRMQRMDKRTGDLEDRTIKITQSQQQSRLEKKDEQNLRDLWDCKK